MSHRIAGVVLFSLCFVIVSFGVNDTSYGQGAFGHQNSFPQAFGNGVLQKARNFFAVESDRKRDDGQPEIALLGPSWAADGSLIRLASIYPQPLFVSICYEGGNEKPIFVGMVASLDSIEFELDDDPRSGGHDFTIKVETRSNILSNLFVSVY